MLLATVDVMLGLCSSPSISLNSDIRRVGSMDVDKLCVVLLSGRNDDER